MRSEELQNGWSDFLRVLLLKLMDWLLDRLSRPDRPRMLPFYVSISLAAIVTEHFPILPSRIGAQADCLDLMGQFRRQR